MSKRKRETNQNDRKRSFFNKSELLNTTLQLCLQYNIHFNYEYSDLSFYRYAEEIVDLDSLNNFNKKLHNSIQSNSEIESI
jgi:hypothetical protein